MNIGDRLQEIRESKDIEADQLAGAIGCPTEAILGIETGFIDTTESMTDALADALGVPLEQLLQMNDVRRTVEGRRALDQYCEAARLESDDRRKVAIEAARASRGATIPDITTFNAAHKRV